MSSLSHHGIKGQRWGVRRFQNKDGTLTAAGRKRKQHLIEVGSGKRKRLIEAAKPFGSSGDYSKDVTGLNRRGIRGQVINEDDNTHVIKKGTSIYRTAANPELNDDGTYSSLTKNDVDRYIDYGRSGELPGADKSNLNSMKIFEFSANRDLKIANGKYITEIITDDVKRKMKNGDPDQIKLGKEILKSFKQHEEDLNISFSPSEMRRSKEAYSRTEAEKEFDRGLLDKANDRLNLYDKKILDYASGKDYRVIRDRLKREGYDGFIDVEDVTTITNLVRGGANTEYPVVILNANDVLTLKRSLKESEIQRRLKRGTKLNMSKGELTNVVQHTSIGGTMYIEGNALILGDSSYLEHHGIKGQRWGIRRFQNRDGSLTNAGRKRLGYATKSAVQTVGKAFKAGVKAGGNAVKAAKAHHEEAEAKKKEKKKEKASQSRLGVLANKDLFTDDELRALNQRFKVEDELKMASIQKGVEIAKAVGTIASNAATAAKAYEDITGQSLSPIKRQAAELKKQQDAEDRARKIAREDAEEARKVAQEERNVKTYEQELRKATASADKEEFLAKKTKAQADQEILKALKGARDFDKPDDDDDDPPKPPNGGGGDGSDDGSSWVQRATAGGKNIFEQMKYDSDPEYRAAKDAHDEKVEWDQHVKERDARIADREKGSKDQTLRDMIDQSNARTGRSQSTPPKPAQPETPEPTKTPRQDSDALFSQKGSLPIDKDRYRNRKAAEKAKKVKEDVAEDRAKKQDEKAAKAAIDTIIKDYQHQDDLVRNANPSRYDRQVALDVIKSKARNTVDKVKHPVDTVAKKISDKAREENWAKERAKLYEEYLDDREKFGPEFANEVYKKGKRQSLQNLGYRGEALEKKLNENSFSKKKKAKHDAFSIQNGVLFVDESVSLSHHGIKGQRWGVRRFQNADGTLTPAGKKRDARRIAKALNKNDKKLAWASRYASDNAHDYEHWNEKADTAKSKGKLDKAERYLTKRDEAGRKRDAQLNIAKGINKEKLALINEAMKQGYEVSAKDYKRKVDTGAEIAMNIAIKTAAYAVGMPFAITSHHYVEGTKYRVKSNDTATHFIDPSEPYLEHHGIRGQRWGVRRFQNADGTLTEAGKKREARQAEKKAKKEAKFHTKAENLRAKDLARYDKMLSKNLTSQDRLNYTELKKYTEKASDKEVLAGSSHAKRAAIGAGIVGTIGLSISGVPNVASIPMGIAIAKAINNQERDNVRIRTINAQNRRKYAEDKTREVASYVEHSALVASISDGLYLEHHGILGQKWGVRRFQDTAGRLTSAGKARLKEAKSSIDSLRPREKKTTNSNKKVQRRGTGEEEMVASGGASWEELDEEEYAAYLEWFKSLSDEELKQLGIKRSEIDAIKSKEDLYALIQKYRQKKTYNTGAAKLINGTINALFSNNLLSVFDPAVVMGSAATAELRKKLAEHRKSKEPIDPKSGFHVKSDANASKIDDMKNVNPGFTDLSDNTKNNCMLCTTTYDLRRRGYDVTAEEVRSGYQTGDVKRWYPDAEIHKVKNYSTVDELINNTEKAISKQGDGARGNIMVTWQQGGGHSMAYEVENGKVVIYDCQTGTRYENAGDILKYTNTVSYARLDNVEPDYDKIKEASN